MATTRSKDLADTLRGLGVRRKLAKQLGDLDGSAGRAGAKGEQFARQAANDLTAASDEIRRRILSRDPKRRAAGRKAANARKRTSAKPRASAKRSAQTRAKATKPRARSRTASHAVV